MAWLEPFIAAFPQWMAAVNTSLFSSLSTDNNQSTDAHNTANPDITSKSSSPSLPNTHLSNISNNINAISMYQRAITLQQTNSDRLNKQIFELEPIVLSSNNASDFECDTDSEISSFSYSIHNYGNGSNQTINSNNNSGVLSEEEYIELHSRLNFDELSSELYESEDELPQWLTINELDKELVINKENTKLNEREWRTLLKTITDYKLGQVSLVINNVVLDELACHYLQRLSVNSKRNTAKLCRLTIENAFFFTQTAYSSKEEELYMFTQNEGILSDSECENDMFVTSKGRYFDMKQFCKSLLNNKDLCEIAIVNSNLGHILSAKCNKEIKNAFMQVLSGHNGLKRINLSRNGISDGSLFTDSLFLRTVPLDHLNLSYNPLQTNDIKSIKWAVTKEYISPFAMEMEMYGNGLSIFGDGNDHKFQMEPTQELQEDIDDMEEQQFISSLFPISIQNKRHKIRFNMNGMGGVGMEDSYAYNTGLNQIELGIQIKPKKRLKKRKMCEEFVYVPCESMEQSLQPGSSDSEGEMNGQLMLRI